MYRKRKRDDDIYTLGTIKKHRGKTATIRRSARGYLRKSGYYGRFSGRGGELKFFDISTGATTVSASGTIIDPSLNLVTQGAGEDQMIGRKITIRSINIKYLALKPNDSDGTLANCTSSDAIRIMIVQDTQCNGSAATIALLNAQANLNGQLLLENSNRFRILKEFRIPLQGAVCFDSNTNVFASTQVVNTGKFYKKCRIPLEFSPEATPGTRVIGEVRTNNIFVAGFSISGVSTIQYVARIRFSDK